MEEYTDDTVGVALLRRYKAFGFFRVYTVAVIQHKVVALTVRNILDTARKRRVEGVAYVRDDRRDHVGFSGAQRLRSPVRNIAELVNGIPNLPDSFGWN